jgi:thiol-disulfide isomerase/thioredoxin
MLLPLRWRLPLAAFALILGLSVAAPAAIRAQDGEGMGGDEGQENLSPEKKKLVEAMTKADKLIEEKKYAEAVGAYDELFKLLDASKELKAEEKKDAEQGARYNYACALSLTGKKEDALKALKRAVELGFWDWSHIAEDKDLDPIRGEADFKKIIEDGKGLEQKGLTDEVAKALKEKPLFDYDFTVKTLDGKELKLSSLKGKVVIVDYWGTWCPPCRKEIPHFVKLYETYKEKGLEIVGIAFEQTTAEEGAKKVKEFAEKNKIKYALAAVDQDDAAMKAVPELEAFPTTLFVDREGKVRLRKVGYHEYGALEGLTKALLEAK